MGGMDSSSLDGCAALEIKTLDAASYTMWDSFVLGHAGGTFFHLSGWKDVIQRTLGRPTFYLYCERGGKIVGVLPLAQVKSFLFGNSLMSLPYLVYGGVIADTPDVEDALVAAACEKATQLGVDHLELKNKAQSSRDWPIKEIYATFSKKLDPDPEKNLAAIPRKQRAMIRKGIKFGLEAESDRDPGRLYSAMLECKRNLGTPFFGRDLFESICDVFGDNVDILTVSQSKKIVCSVMSFKFRDEILPYYGGGGDLARVVNGNDFMYWSVMEKACQEGIQIFDYGRSMIGSGAYRFKKHWGFEPTPLCYEYFLVNGDAVPSLNPSNPKYKLMIEAWKRLPLGAANLLGPPIAKRLG